MSYSFIESKYPDEDPNADLDFDNDIIYSAILSDKTEKKKDRKPDTVPVDVLPKQIAETKNLKDKTKNKSDIWLYITFIIAIIFIILIWFIYGGKSEKKIEPIDKYADVAELTMLSPDLGMGVRYGHI